MPHDFDEINAFVFQQSCIFVGVCHSSAGKEGGLNLEADPYAALIGVPATNIQAAADELVRVAPCTPKSSFLDVKVTLFQRPNAGVLHYGANMPLDRAFLPDVQIAAIRDWILRGAPRTESDAGSLCAVDAGGSD